MHFCFHKPIFFLLRHKTVLRTYFYWFVTILMFKIVKINAWCEMAKMGIGKIEGVHAGCTHLYPLVDIFWRNLHPHTIQSTSTGHPICGKLRGVLLLYLTANTNTFCRGLFPHSSPPVFVSGIIPRRLLCLYSHACVFAHRRISDFGWGSWCRLGITYITMWSADGPWVEG